MNQVETFKTAQILDINNITALYLLTRNVQLRGSFVHTRNANNSVSLKIGGDCYSLNRDRVDKLELFKLLTEISNLANLNSLLLKVGLQIFYTKGKNYTKSKKTFSVGNYTKEEFEKNPLIAAKLLAKCIQKESELNLGRTTMNIIWDDQLTNILLALTNISASETSFQSASSGSANRIGFVNKAIHC